MTEQNFDFENPFTPALPAVDRVDIEDVSLEKELNVDFVQETLERLMTEQPELTDKMKRWIAVTARDAIEVGRMIETFTVTYRLLEVAKYNDDGAVDTEPKRIAAKYDH